MRGWRQCCDAMKHTVGDVLWVSPLLQCADLHHTIFGTRAHDSFDTILYSTGCLVSLPHTADGLIQQACVQLTQLVEGHHRSLCHCLSQAWSVIKPATTHQVWPRMALEGSVIYCHGDVLFVLYCLFQVALQQSAISTVDETHIL
jgi:hypothetical protein